MPAGSKALCGHLPQIGNPSSTAVMSGPSSPREEAGRHAQSENGLNKGGPHVPDFSKDGNHTPSLDNPITIHHWSDTKETKKSLPWTCSIWRSSKTKKKK